MAAIDGAMRESQHRLIVQALTEGRLKSWDFQPFEDTSRQYMRNSIDLDDLAAVSRNQSVRPDLLPTSQVTILQPGF